MDVFYVRPYTKPGTFSEPKRLKNGSGFLLLHDFLYASCYRIFILQQPLTFKTVAGVAAQSAHPAGNDAWAGR